jgi:hypothetical protein
MGTKRVVTLCGVIALALGGAASASAAKTLELSTSEGTIAPGSALDLGGASTFETPVGSVSCSSALFVATLLNNNSSKDKIAIEAGPPNGTNGVLCTTNTALGSVEVKAGGLPWTEQFAVSGKATLKGHKRLTLTVTLPALFGLQCSYEAKKIAQTFPVAAIGVAAPLQLAVSNQAFARSASSNALCPASVSADFAALPIAVEGAGATLLPVLVTRRAA